MSETTIQRLHALGIQLPKAAMPAANYVSFAQSGSLIFTSGQLPLKDGRLINTGILGAELDVAAGQEAAKQCAINIISQIDATTGDLERIVRIVKLTIFVASTPEFTSQHLVGNGASDFLVAVLGDKGKHARSAVGVPSLPLNAPVEIEAVVEVRL